MKVRSVPRCASCGHRISRSVPGLVLRDMDPGNPLRDTLHPDESPCARRVRWRER